jgi:hypothetical protein
MFTIVLLRHYGRVILLLVFICFILPFVLLRQKGGVFFVLDQDCIFKPVK